MGVYLGGVGGGGGGVGWDAMTPYRLRLPHIHLSIKGRSVYSREGWRGGGGGEWRGGSASFVAA